MSLFHPHVALSTSPDSLEFAAALDVGIELKFDWEHTDLLAGRRSLATRLDEAGVDPSRVRSVHLPPGTVTRGDDIGMAATETNRGTIVDFVQSQLSVVPEAHLVLHPPKQFEYGALLSLLGELCRLTGRELAIENTSVESYWHAPEDMAFFAYAGTVTPSLDSLYLTVDSAHVPHRTAATQVDENRVDAIVDRIESESMFAGSAVGAEFRAFVRQSVADASESLPDGLEENEWTRLLNTLCLTGDRVREIHLNDPVADGLPTLSAHGNEVLDVVATVVRQRDVTVVLEPGATSRSAIRETLPELAEWLEQ